MSRCHSFVAIPEYATAISWGLVDEFADMLMPILGNVGALSIDHTCIFLDLYMDSKITCKVPPSSTKTGGTKAAGSQMLRIAPACSKKSNFSSLDDETSHDVALGEGMGTQPTSELLLFIPYSGKMKLDKENQRCIMHRLAQQVSEIVLNTDSTVLPPKLTGDNLATASW